MTTIHDADPTVVDAAAIDRLPARALGPGIDAGNRVLWSDGTSMAGVLTVPAGGRLGVHAHRRNHHHIWVIEGQARVVGNDLGPGGYAHVPAGVAHDIEATGGEDCTVFYLYVRQA
jgi:mannose-6-phosphate isomerase-like protein (cupin superfamily)